MKASTRIARTLREHFIDAVERELSKFEHKERAFRQADREERAAKMKLPLGIKASVHRDTVQR